MLCKIVRKVSRWYCLLQFVFVSGSMIAAVPYFLHVWKSCWVEFLVVSFMQLGFCSKIQKTFDVSMDIRE